ncbi:MAG TPA: 3-keto-5-aminohexanoate cleavage protein, partial [Pyrinomonadaceae bacterium]|nr:3-keto-5-aminohexanoate cleavage protein [Pyrinomonadaceae bacterium]
INGGRSKRDHPLVPVTADEQAAAVIECLAAGASAIHLHVRSTSGDESLAAVDVAHTLRAVRIAAPGVQVGVSTGEWIVPDPSLRLKAITGWTELPDFASVNFNEDGAFEIAQLLISRGVAIEAGLCDAGAAAKLLNSTLAQRCMRILLEPQEQQLERARGMVKAIESSLDRAGIELPRLLHGTEATAWDVLREAIKRGYDTRIGFEDTLLLPDGAVAATNAELVSEAKRLMLLGGSV